MSILDNMAKLVLYSVTGFFSSRPNWVLSHPLARKGVLPLPPLDPRRETHSLGVGRPNSDEGPDTRVLYVYYNPSTWRIILAFKYIFVLTISISGAVPYLNAVTDPNQGANWKSDFVIFCPLHSIISIIPSPRTSVPRPEDEAGCELESLVVSLLTGRHSSGSADTAKWRQRSSRGTARRCKIPRIQ